MSECTKLQKGPIFQGLSLPGICGLRIFLLRVLWLQSKNIFVEGGPQGCLTILFDQFLLPRMAFLI